uniref:Uncharacterized protein n=1 Tax=Romanomermis culicivorax TaxID=13658 RepID=A0A915KZ99_ROMCU
MDGSVSFGEIKSTNRSGGGSVWSDSSTTDMRAIFAFVCLGGGLLMDWIGGVLGQAILGPVGLLALGFAVPEIAYSLFPDAEKTYTAFFEQYTWSEMSW